MKTSMVKPLICSCNDLTSDGGLIHNGEESRDHLRKGPHQGENSWSWMDYRYKDE